MIVTDYKLDLTPEGDQVSFYGIETAEAAFVTFYADKRDKRRTVKDGFSDALDASNVGVRVHSPSTGLAVETISQGGGLWYGLGSAVLAIGGSLLCWSGETTEPVAVDFSYDGNSYKVDVTPELLQHLSGGSVPTGRTLLFVDLVKYDVLDLTEEVSSVPVVLEN